MQAACYMGARTLSVLEREPRPPAPDEVEIAVAYTGICGTDLHILHGAMDERVAVPAVIGHEMSGTVAAVGDGVDRLVGRRPGRRSCRSTGAASAPPAWPATRTSATAWTSSASTRPARCKRAGPSRRALLVALPEDLPLRTRRSSSPPRSPCTTSGAPGCGRVSTSLVVGGGPIGLLIASVARCGRRGGARAASSSAAPPRGRRPSWGSAVRPRLGRPRRHASTTGRTAPARPSRSRSPAPRPASTLRSADSPSAAASWSSAIHATPPPVDLFRVFWRELTLIGARVYERERLRAGGRPARERRRSRADALISAVEPLDGRRRTPSRPWTAGRGDEGAHRLRRRSAA